VSEETSEPKARGGGETTKQLKTRFSGKIKKERERAGFLTIHISESTKKLRWGKLREMILLWEGIIKSLGKRGSGLMRKQDFSISSLKKRWHALDADGFVEPEGKPEGDRDTKVGG